jgi:L-threonylcarbamoyladenylate synthase
MDEEILKTIEILKAGGLILYPTDTIWGLGCDATNPDAVEKLYKLKKRVAEKSMSILVCNDAMINKYIPDIPVVSWDLIDSAEEPLTIIYPGSRQIAENVLAPDGSLGVRLIKDKFCNKLIYKFRKPIVTTSANISGGKTPTSFGDIHPDIIKGVDHIINMRQDEINNTKPSTLIKLKMNGEVTVLRD